MHEFSFYVKGPVLGEKKVRRKRRKKVKVEASLEKVPVAKSESVVIEPTPTPTSSAVTENEENEQNEEHEEVEEDIYIPEVYIYEPDDLSDDPVPGPSFAHVDESLGGEKAAFPASRRGSVSVKSILKSKQPAQQEVPEQPHIIEQKRADPLCIHCHESDQFDPLVALCYCARHQRLIHVPCLQPWLKIEKITKCEYCHFKITRERVTREGSSFLGSQAREGKKSIWVDIMVIAAVTPLFVFTVWFCYYGTTELYKDKPQERNALLAICGVLGGAYLLWVTVTIYQRCQAWRRWKEKNTDIAIVCRPKEQQEEFKYKRSDTITGVMCKTQKTELLYIKFILNEPKQSKKRKGKKKPKAKGTDQQNEGTRPRWKESKLLVKLSRDSEGSQLTAKSSPHSSLAFNSKTEQNSQKSVLNLGSSRIEEDEWSEEERKHKIAKNTSNDTYKSVTYNSASKSDSSSQASKSDSANRRHGWAVMRDSRMDNRESEESVQGTPLAEQEMPADEQPKVSVRSRRQSLASSLYPQNYRPSRGVVSFGPYRPTQVDSESVGLPSSSASSSQSIPYIEPSRFGSFEEDEEAEEEGELGMSNDRSDSVISNQTSELDYTNGRQGWAVMRDGLMDSRESDESVQETPLPEQEMPADEQPKVSVRSRRQSLASSLYPQNYRPSRGVVSFGPYRPTQVDSESVGLPSSSASSSQSIPYIGPSRFGSFEEDEEAEVEGELGMSNDRSDSVISNQTSELDYTNGRQLRQGWAVMRDGLMDSRESDESVQETPLPEQEMPADEQPNVSVRSRRQSLVSSLYPQNYGVSRGAVSFGSSRPYQMDSESIDLPSSSSSSSNESVLNLGPSRILSIQEDDETEEEGEVVISKSASKSRSNQSHSSHH